MDQVHEARPGQEELQAWRRRLEQRALAPLSGVGWRYVLWMAFLLTVIAWALYAYSRQLDSGLIVTGMRDRISWGLYIVGLVFFIGISHAGTLLSAILRVSHARWQMSITRMAEFITAVALMVAALCPLIDMGRPERVLNLFIFGRWQSPLVWDIFAITTYLTGSVIYLFLPLIPDFALCRDRLAADAPAWRRWFFTLAAVGWSGSAPQRHALERAMTVMMVVIIPVAVSVHTVVSWVFAMTLRDPFNSTIFGAFFVAGAIYSGIAAIVILMAVLRVVLHLEEYITPRQFVYLGYLLATLAAIMGYMNISEYLTTGYKMEEGVWFHIHQLTVGPFAGLFWFYIIGGILAPALLILFSRTRNIKGVITAAVLALIGMFIERYLIVVAGFRVPLMSYPPASYFPTWVEWSIFAGALALFAFIISVFVKLFPVISIWEVVEQRGPEPAWGEQTPVPIPVPQPAFGVATVAVGPTNSGTAPAAISTARPPNKSFNRREILRLGAGFGAALLLAPVLGVSALRNIVARAGASVQTVGKRLRRWGMVIDLRSCDGCQALGKPPQCTQACIEGHFAPEPMEWIQVYETPLRGGGSQFVPTPCQQCQNPPCVNVCPVAATFQTPEGAVLIDQERCIGCRLCMEACPYDRRFFNWGDPALPPEAILMKYDVEHQSPAIRGTVMKCDFCPDMARSGSLPYCAQACPNRAIYFGDLEEDLATNGKDVVKLSRFLSEDSTYRLKENLGTQPRVYYVPGHGEAVGRDAFRAGRLASIWPWKNRVKGGRIWSR